jgi:hypothetical protein
MLARAAARTPVAAALASPVTEESLVAHLADAGSGW